MATDLGTFKLAVVFWIVLLHLANRDRLSVRMRLMTVACRISMEIRTTERSTWMVVGLI